MAAFQTAAMHVKSDVALPSIDLPKEFPAIDGVAATEPSGITVAYAGMVDEGEYPYLKFVVYNRTSGPLTYGAQASEWPFPDVRVNGRRPVLNGYRCGSGMRRFVIDPGSSAEFRMGPYEFDRAPAKGSLITVGYFLSDRDGEFGRQFFPSPFFCPMHSRRLLSNGTRCKKTIRTNLSSPFRIAEKVR